VIVLIPDLEFPCIRHPDGYSFTMLDDWHFCVDGIQHTVERGFYSDSLTVPRRLGFLRTLILFFIPRTGIYLPAVLIHDWLTRQDINDWQLANDVFESALVAVGTNSLRRRFMVAGVRLYALTKDKPTS